jgi:hypothetical protein
MTGSEAARIERLPGWQLVAEFEVVNSIVDDRPWVDQVIHAVQRLNLQPVQRERIHEAFVQAVNRATRRGSPSLSLYPVYVRIWVLGTGDGRGWSFFMVEKQEPDPPHTEAGHRVELFLYQQQDA